eukprot:XP_011664330.1 PREDICTED: desmin-like [Strongylocentrotus purpuratus]
MSAIIYPPAPLSRQQEKAELSELNDRMQNYLGKVKKIREQANKQTIEWRNRLEDEANRILQLEGKVRELSRPDNTLQEVLAQVRAAAAAELQKYKEQSEATFHRNIQQLKNKIDTDATEMEYMNNENKRLGTKLEEQQCDLTRLNNQLTAAESANRNLRDTVSIEREKTSAHIRNLEDKLRDMQEALVEKMREITKATDSKQANEGGA